MSKVKINQGRTLMPHFRWAYSLVLLCALAVSFVILPEFWAIVLAMMLSFSVPLIWSSFYILEIDPNQKVIKEYTLIMGKPFFIHTTVFDRIEKIFINKNRTKQMVQSRSGKVTHIKHSEFQACLKLFPAQKFPLISDRNIDKLDQRLEPIVKKLDTVVVRTFE